MFLSEQCLYIKQSFGLIYIIVYFFQKRSKYEGLWKDDPVGQTSVCTGGYGRHATEDARQVSNDKNIYRTKDFHQERAITHTRKIVHFT